MPYSSDNFRWYYQTEGSGPLVVLLHGLLMNGQSWRQSGLVQALSKDYCVAYPDLPGHGLSDKTADSDAYSLRVQASGVIKLIDTIGYEKAQVIGYSSGAWLTAGLLQYYPERLSSALIGGWDIVNGLPQGPDGPLKFDFFMSYARKTAPELASWVTPDAEAGLSAFFHSLSQHQPMDTVIKQSCVPVAFWAGKDDPGYSSIEAWAKENEFPFLSGNGDHVTAMLQPDSLTLHQIQAFINQVCSK